MIPSQDDMTLPAKRRRFARFSVPRWFKKGFWIWLAFILAVVALAYTRYSFGPNWTPDHLIQIFRLGV